MIKFVMLFFALAISATLVSLGGVGTFSQTVGVFESAPTEPRTEYHWVRKAKMPTARVNVAGAAIGGMVYAIGGMDNAGQTLTTVEIYDPTKNTWRRGRDLPAPRHSIAAVAIGNTIYTIGGLEGFRSSPKDEVFAFDTETEEWSEKAPLPSARGAHAAAVLNGKIYVVGGIGGNGTTSDLFVYDPQTDAWETKKSAIIRRGYLNALAFEGKLYVVAGRDGATGKNTAAVEIYNPKTDSWEQGLSENVSRSGAGIAFFDGMIAVAGGEDGEITLNDVEGFDASKNQWISLPTLPTARHGLAFVNVDGRLYAIGGGTFPGFSVSGFVEMLESVRVDNDE